jgi:hypothetical protein
MAELAPLFRGGAGGAKPLLLHAGVLVVVVLLLPIYRLLRVVAAWAWELGGQRHRDTSLCGCGISGVCWLLVVGCWLLARLLAPGSPGWSPLSPEPPPVLLPLFPSAAAVRGAGAGAAQLQLGCSISKGGAELPLPALRRQAPTSRRRVGQGVGWGPQGSPPDPAAPTSAPSKL